MILAFDLGVATAGACLMPLHGEPFIDSLVTKKRTGTKSDSWAARLDELLEWATPLAYRLGNNGGTIITESMSYPRGHDAQVATSLSFGAYKTLAKVFAKRFLSVQPKVWQAAIIGKKPPSKSIDAKNAAHAALRLTYDLDSLGAHIRPADRSHSFDALGIAHFLHNRKTESPRDVSLGGLLPIGDSQSKGNRST